MSFNRRASAIGVNQHRQWGSWNKRGQIYSDGETRGRSHSDVSSAGQSGRKRRHTGALAFRRLAL